MLSEIYHWLPVTTSEKLANKLHFGSFQKAVSKALKNGYSFGASTKNEIKLAKIINNTMF